MFNPKLINKLPLFLIVIAAVALSGCIKPKSKQKAATLLKASEATQTELESQIAYLAQVTSMRAKMYLKFEDNSFAEFGSADVYRRADGDIVVQRPASIRMKVEVPVIGTDVAQMTSDGERFRVAILQDGGSGKNKKFIIGTNAADYSILQQRVSEIVKDDPKQLRSSVNAFANLRPQHFTDALLVRPLDRANYSYLVSTILEEEIDFKLYKRKNPLGWVLRGYYLLDEFKNNGDGELIITRRFWFDRVGGALLTRQQIFGLDGEIESDIVYGQRGKISADSNLDLPLEVEVTRPKEKYTLKLIHAAPDTVKIGRPYPESAFMLENEWDLETLDLDKKLIELRNGGSENANRLVEIRRQN